ncbi:hypothetical protein GPECTOR_8g217 [Gonium pectorale]|uniref:DNA2/NAM7 helicase helicase domain-containing protein n=1 Tax=Gonium pectorale TaxID=33097 RepID=A0A150GST3_GONPE|nr:hypothetical protein GPECTOR_8g217 [Gonium pectorale]|eukprot:KXZ52834.1 hypothetical protein GPECTOR_8g217 [Gonium pectorale]
MDSRRGGNGGGAAACPLALAAFNLRGGAGVDSAPWQLVQSGGGGDRDDGASPSLEKSPPLKPTDLILLTNSRDVDSLGQHGVAYTLGVVKGARQDDDEDDDDDGGDHPDFRAAVYVPVGGDLEAAFEGQGRAGEWFAVCVGNVATATRTWDALQCIASSYGNGGSAAACLPPQPPPLLKLLLCSGGPLETASARRCSHEGDVSATGTDPPRSIRAAVKAYCDGTRRLNPSQRDAVVTAAMAYLSVAAGGSVAAQSAASGSGSETWARGSLIAATNTAEGSCRDFRGAASVCGSCGLASSGPGGARLLMVQGPPGTGKTSTIAAMLSVLSGLAAGPTLQQRQQPGNGRGGARGGGGAGGAGAGALLVCAPTNAAVGEVAARARRLAAALAGPAGWSGTLSELRRLLTAPADVHQQALRADQLARAADPVAAPAPAVEPPPATLGAFLKQQLPTLTDRLGRICRTLLDDLPSGAWAWPYEKDELADGLPGGGDEGSQGGGVAGGRAALTALLEACKALAELVGKTPASRLTQFFSAPRQVAMRLPATAGGGRSGLTTASVTTPLAASPGRSFIPPPPPAPGQAAAAWSPQPLLPESPSLPSLPLPEAPSPHRSPSGSSAVIEEQAVGAGEGEGEAGPLEGAVRRVLAALGRSESALALGRLLSRPTVEMLTE